MNPVSYFLYSEASGFADPAGTEAPCSQADQFLEMVQEAPRMSSLGKPANPEPTPQGCLSLGVGVACLTFRLLSICPNHPRARNQTTRGSP